MELVVGGMALNFMRLIIAIVILMVGICRSPAPFYPNYFTTNANPSVSGAAISNALNVSYTLDAIYANNTPYYAIVTAGVTAKIPAATIANTVAVGIAIGVDEAPIGGGYVDNAPSYNYGSTVGSTNALYATGIISPGANWTVGTASASLLTAGKLSIAYFATNSGSGGSLEQNYFTTNQIPFAINHRPDSITLNNYVSSGFTGQTNLRSCLAIGASPNSTSITSNFKSYVMVSNTSNSKASISITNVYLDGWYITNAAVGFEQSAIIGVNKSSTISDGRPAYVGLKFCDFFSSSYCVKIYGSESERWSGDFTDCSFTGGNQGFSAWHGDGNFRNCIFSATNILASQVLVDGTSLAFEANDYSVNHFDNCTFNYGGSPVESAGIVFFLGSHSDFNNCRFICTSNNAPRYALIAGENFMQAQLNNCTFNLNGGLLLYQYQAEPQNGKITFNNCFLDPYTNGIVVETYSATEAVPITVIGGNLKPSNFDRPSLVTFIATPPTGLSSYLAANFTSTSATMANTALSVEVIAGRKYTFKAIILTSDSTAADGVKVDFDGGTATATNFRVQATAFDTALNFSTQSSALATDLLAATFTGNGSIECHGSFEPATSGSFIIRASQNAHTVGTLTVYRGSHLILTELP